MVLGDVHVYMYYMHVCISLSEPAPMEASSSRVHQEMMVSCHFARSLNLNINGKKTLQLLILGLPGDILSSYILVVYYRYTSSLLAMCIIPL